MDRRTTLHETLQQRVYGGISSGLVFKRARGSKYLIQCLKRSGNLAGHEGCVNTITWSDSGELLLSGSDDCRLNLYRPRENKLLQSIRSGHRANIFSAKFLPCTSNKWIVSCAGDGMLQFTDLDRPERIGQCSFNCHVGTTYEVITTPGDPNTFLSCGEDGTVRMFDLRTKTKCSTRDCREDVLIDSGKAVTSICVNPLAPYQLSIGCENSTVGVFDRRSLSTASHSSGANKMKGMVCKFRPDALSDRSCRVTSLNYSEDGGELLVSYCADYLYLFNMRGPKTTRLSPGNNGENGYNLSPTSQRSNLPLKRLRLRGDWSDTGPNARPDSEAPSAESSLMQRMSDMFVRWIEESFRANQRRPRTTSGTSSSSLSPDSSLMYSSSTSSESGGSAVADGRAEGAVRGRQASTRGRHSEGETPRSSRNQQRTRGQSEATPQGSQDISTEPESINLRSAESMETDFHEACAGPSTINETSDRDHPTESMDVESDDVTSGVTGSDDVTSGVAASDGVTSGVAESSDVTSVRPSSTRRVPFVRFREAYAGEKEDFTDRDELAALPDEGEHSRRDGRGVQGVVIERGRGARGVQEQSMVRGMGAEGVKEEGVPCIVVLDSREEETGVDEKTIETGALATEETMETCETMETNNGDLAACKVREIETDNQCECFEGHERENRRRVMNEAPTTNESTSSAQTVGEATLSTPTAGRSMPSARTASESTPSAPTTSESTPSVRITGESAPSTRTVGESTPSIDIGMASEGPLNYAQSFAATRIQRMFRQHRSAKTEKEAWEKEWEQGGWGQDRELWQPEMTRMYRGHRNARTMIKEAAFWGDRFVVSGSDCGRIFIWDKKSCEIVMVLPGDKHVVNCVQPHPFDPVLASSGIDYDIKLWSPTSEYPHQPLGDLDEIIKRNETMLEESRDTITVPASFMLRMLASLNHARFARRNQDDSDTDTSDDE